MAYGCPRGTFDHISYDLPDPLNKPIIDLYNVFDSSGKET
jgi:hypothetical protein